MWLDYIKIFLYEGSRTNEIICTRALYDGKYELVRSCTFYLRAYFSYILKTQIIITNNIIDSKRQLTLSLSLTHTLGVSYGCCCLNPLLIM